MRQIEANAGETDVVQCANSREISLYSKIVDEGSLHTQAVQRDNIMPWGAFNKYVSY